LKAGSGLVGLLLALAVRAGGLAVFGGCLEKNRFYAARNGRGSDDPKRDVALSMALAD